MLATDEGLKSSVLDSCDSNVQQNHFKKSYRAKHVVSPSAEFILSVAEGLRINSVEGTPRRKDPAVSFRPKGEIFLRSLASARDDGPQPVTFAPLRES